MRNRLRVVLLGLLITLGSITASLLVCEWVFRTWVLKSDVPHREREFFALMRQEHPEFPYVSFDQGHPSFRILGLSDSFGVNGGAENYHHLLEERFHAAGHDQVEVLNVSVPHYEPFEAARLLERFGIRFAPQIVLYGLFVGNDMHPRDVDLVQFRDISVVKRPWRLFAPGSWTVKGWLAGYRALLLERARKREEQPAGADPEEEGSWTAETFLGVLRSYLAHFRLSYRASDEWLEVQQIIGRMRETAEAAGAVYVLAILPDQLQVEDAYRERLIKTDRLDPDQYDFRLPQRLLQEVAAAEDIPVIDLLEAFRDRGRQGGLYLFRDTHWNARGNRLAAEAIAEHFFRKKLLKRQAWTPQDHVPL